MPDASRSSLPGRAVRGIAETWRELGFEQRLAGIGATLLIVSTFGPFSFVEGAIVLIGLSVLFLLRRRAQGREFHLPFGDGTMIAAAGLWSAALILLRLFSRPLGQGLLALVCAAILVFAGLREHARRPPDDLPGEARDRQRGSRKVDDAPRSRPRRRRRGASAPTELFGVDPPEWTTPQSGDPSAAEPPAWSRRAPKPPTDPVPAAPAESQPSESPRASKRVPPASPIARASEESEDGGGG